MLNLNVSAIFENKILFVRVSTNYFNKYNAFRIVSFTLVELISGLQYFQNLIRYN